MIYRVHKVVLAAASDWFNELFTKNDHKLINKFSLPKHIQTSSANVDDVIFPLVMKYIYANQV